MSIEFTSQRYAASVLDFGAKGNGIADDSSAIQKALDHRLRVMFPTDVETNFSWADSAYDVVRRSVDRPDKDDWLETRLSGSQPTKSMLNLSSR